MSHRKQPTNYQAGFTIVEMLIVLLVLGLVTTAMYSTFRSSILEYLALQNEGSSFTELASQSQRIANVLRGATGFVSADSQDLVVYAYFSPADTYVSQIHYYLNSSKTQLLADVTRMTANPPTGTLITTSTQTFTIINNFYQASGVNLFTYLDSGNGVITTPVSDTTSISSIKVSLAVPGSTAGSNQAVSVQVSLRNRKTNL